MSTTSIHSSLWYRVATLRPRLLARAKLHRHRFRGKVWYLLQDPASGRVHRFSPGARLLLAGMDGRRSVADLWALAQRQLGEDAPTQDEVIHLLGQLHAADLLQTDVSPDALEAFDRGTRQAAQKRWRSWANPMAVRIPLWDPGRFLDRFAALWPLLWGRRGLAVWLAVVLPALVLLPPHWPELSGNLSDRVLQVDNLLLLWLVFPVIKFLHEMGHASATRAGGGEVHDMGLMLLVLMPVPYVDASSATVFRSKWRRALVAAAGMAVELFLAALAFYVWLAVEPGFVRSVAFNVMLVAGVSTLIFNGNPLLRYDAYYILADLIELPNLAQQASRHWGYLAQRFVLRADSATPVANSPSEAVWLTVYGAASTIYRMLVTVAIALFIATRFFFIGVLLALWAVVMMAVVPLIKVLMALNGRAQLRELRGRAWVMGGGGLALLALLLCVVPLPFRSQAEGVVWLPEQATVRAGTSGFVASHLAPPDSAVVAGQPLIANRDPATEAQVAVLEARVAELEANYALEFVSDRARAAMVRDQLAAESQALARARERAAALLVASQNTGRFVVVRPQDQPGRFYRQGEVLGFVIDSSERAMVKVVVTQADIDTIGLPGGQVQMRLAHEPERVIEGRILRQQPAGKNELPSRVLAVGGGGQIAIDPRDSQGVRAIERLFQIDVEPLGAAALAPLFGQRVHVRFDHPPLPLAVQWYRSLRRLLLTHFDV
jgi:putative peptide zinc metalloprotease protein